MRGRSVEEAAMATDATQRLTAREET